MCVHVCLLCIYTRTVCEEINVFNCFRHCAHLSMDNFKSMHNLSFMPLFFLLSYSLPPSLSLALSLIFQRSPKHIDQRQYWPYCSYLIFQSWPYLAVVWFLKFVVIVFVVVAAHFCVCAVLFR